MNKREKYDLSKLNFSTHINFISLQISGHQYTSEFKIEFKFKINIYNKFR